MMAVQLKIGFRDAVRDGHVVVNSRSRPTVRAGTVFPSPTDRRIDRHIGNVDTLRHQFSRHTLCEPGLGMTEDDCPFCTVGIGLFSRMSRAARWPTRNALNAEFRSVSNAILGSASVISLPKMPGTRPSMLCTTSVGAPRSRTIFWNSIATAAGSLASHA